MTNTSKALILFFSIFILFQFIERFKDPSVIQSIVIFVMMIGIAWMIIFFNPVVSYSKPFYVKVYVVEATYENDNRRHIVGIFGKLIDAKKCVEDKRTTYAKEKHMTKEWQDLHVPTHFEIMQYDVKS